MNVWKNGLKMIVPHQCNNCEKRDVHVFPGAKPKSEAATFKGRWPAEGALTLCYDLLHTDLFVLLIANIDIVKERNANSFISSVK